MALLQRAIETYDSHIDYTQNSDVSTPMAPIAHKIAKADLEITLNADGEFENATAVNGVMITLPVTEDSAGRTSAPCPHPLCERLDYLLPHNEKKYQLYVDQLEKWVNSEYSHPKAVAVLNYVRNGSILSDLEKCGLIKKSKTGSVSGNDRLICWRVLGDEPTESWKDLSLIQTYEAYYRNHTAHEYGFCMTTGEETDLAKQHAKALFSRNANAKLISSNDTKGFTYRGRFTDERQALQIGYEASQKAHNALRWLISEQGDIGGRAFLCWNPQGITVTHPTRPCRPPKTSWSPSDYQNELRKTLNSQKNHFTVSDGVIVAAFDAATTGRLALTYYNEFRAHDFLERLYAWDTRCCWIDYRYGIESPTLKKIADCAFGVQVKSTKNSPATLVTDDKILSQQLQRLLACRVEKAAIGTDIVKSLASRASQPHSYEHNVWENILFTACAVIRKYRYDRFKEDWNMALEPEKKDRSYQFGRLLAVMEKVELDTYRDSEKDYRQPNALRLMSVFCKRPMHTAANLQKQLEQAYYRQLKKGQVERYKKLTEQIMDIISQTPDEQQNLPLEDSYLMGYYLQRNALFTKPEKDTEEDKQ